MQSMIKRGVVLVSAVVLMGMAQAQASVSVEYYSLTQTYIIGTPVAGYQDQFATVASSYSSDGSFRSFLENMTTSTGIGLPAPSFIASKVYGMSADQQVGVATNTYGSLLQSLPAHLFYFDRGAQAGMWTGASHDYVSLHPSGFSYSAAFATDGTHQVGAAGLGGNSVHAMLWSGTAESAVDLNPAGYTFSEAMAIDGDAQGGSAFVNTTGHAALWHGTADSFVDLNPSGAGGSQINAMAGGEQYGSAFINGQLHAMMWNGTAESAMDLHPAQYGYSEVTGASAEGIQIGITRTSADFGTTLRAAAWMGTPESYIDLSAYLPASTWTSKPLWIDGNVIYGVAAIDNSPNPEGVAPGTYLVAWTITTIAGDTNFDGVVDVTDYNNVINNFGGTGLGDANYDGIVDISDFNDVINNFGSSEAMTVSFVPEPTSLGLLGIGAMGLMRRRRV